MISLGLSCHSRFLIASAGAEERRYPFDWNISTKRFLLDALAENGAGFEFRRENLSVYRLPQAKVEGVRAGDAYPWHEFGRDPDGRLPLDWESKIDSVNEKYRALWPRFAALLRSPWTAKCLILSNCQENLTEFADSDADFAEKFTLTPDFIDRLIARLDAFGARRFRLMLFLRTLPERLAFAAAGERRWGGRVVSRFVGVLNNEPAHNLIAQSSLAASRRFAWRPTGAICGAYDNGTRIDAAGRGRYIAYRAAAAGPIPCAEAWPFGYGFVFVFGNAPGDVRQAAYDRGTLRFAGGEEWRRLKR